MGALLARVNWNDLRSKAWHAGLVAASAYVATDPRLAWLVPVLTAAAGASTPPATPTRAALALPALAAFTVVVLS